MKRSVRWTTMLGLFFTLSLGAAAQGETGAAPQAPPADQGTPRIKLDRLIHDFKDVKPALELNTEFTLSNTGTALLEIRDVRTTCGCTVPALAKRMLGPGESTTMTVKLRPPNTAGLVDKKINITTNDPNLPQIQLSLLANVVVDVVVEPQFVRFDGVSRTEPAQMDVWLTPKVFEKFQITELKSESPYVTVTQTAENSRIHLVIKLDAPAVPPSSSEFMNTLIHLKTTSETHPDILLPVNIRFTPEFSAIPQRLQVYMKASDKVITRDIIVKHANEKPFNITAVRSSNAFVKPEVVKNDQGSNVISVTIEAQPNVPLIQGIVTVEMAAKTIAVPFRVNVDSGQAVSPGPRPQPVVTPVPPPAPGK